MVYLITRHPGALAWLKTKINIPAIHIDHIHDMDMIEIGDVVIGTLPVSLVAWANARGARYFHLEVSVPVELRGQELSKAQLEQLGASLVQYVSIRNAEGWNEFIHEKTRG